MNKEQIYQNAISYCHDASSVLEVKKRTDSQNFDFSIKVKEMRLFYSLKQNVNMLKLSAELLVKNGEDFKLQEAVMKIVEDCKYKAMFEKNRVILRTNYNFITSNEDIEEDVNLALKEMIVFLLEFQSNPELNEFMINSVTTNDEPVFISLEKQSDEPVKLNLDKEIEETVEETEEEKGLDLSLNLDADLKEEEQYEDNDANFETMQAEAGAYVSSEEDVDRMERAAKLREKIKEEQETQKREINVLSERKANQKIEIPSFNKKYVTASVEPIEKQNISLDKEDINVVIGEDIVEKEIDKAIEEKDIENVASIIEQELNLVLEKEKYLAQEQEHIAKMKENLEAHKVQVKDQWTAFYARLENSKQKEQDLLSREEELVSRGLVIEEQENNLASLKEEEQRLLEFRESQAEKVKEFEEIAKSLEEKEQLISDEVELNKTQIANLNKLLEDTLLELDNSNKKIESMNATMISKIKVNNIQAKLKAAEEEVLQLKETENIKMQQLEADNKKLQEEVELMDKLKARVNEVNETKAIVEREQKYGEEERMALVSEIEKLKGLSDPLLLTDKNLNLLLGAGYEAEILSAEQPTVISCNFDDCNMLVYCEEKFFFIQRHTKKARKNANVIMQMNQEEITESYMCFNDRVACKKCYTDLLQDITRVSEQLHGLK